MFYLDRFVVHSAFFIKRCHCICRKYLPGNNRGAQYYVYYRGAQYYVYYRGAQYYVYFMMTICTLSYNSLG